MTEKTRLIEMLDSMIVHPIIREALTEEINNGNILTDEQLKEKAQEYEEEL